MTTLDAKERRYAMAGAGFGAAASVVLWAPSFDRAAGVQLALIGVAMSALLALAARSGRRLLTGIAAVVLSFGPWGFAWVIGLPYLVLAGWLALRAGRAAAPGARAAPALDEKPPGRTSAAGTGRPTPNKRYTPPQRRR